MWHQNHIEKFSFIVVLMLTKDKNFLFLGPFRFDDESLVASVIPDPSNRIRAEIGHFCNKAIVGIGEYLGREVIADQKGHGRFL